MRYAVLALLLLSACKSASPPATKAAAKQDEKTPPGTVMLTLESQKRASLVVETLQADDAAEVIRANGVLTVNEDQTSGAGAIVDGRMVSVFAAPGDFVRAGQVLARMHSHDVHDSRASYRKAEEDLSRAKAAEVTAERMRDRARKLFELKASSRNDVERAEMELRDAQAASRKAEADVTKERLHLTEFLEVPAKDSNDGHAHAGDDVPIKAPSAGVVMVRHFPAGSALSAGQEVFRISNLSSLWLVANVSEADLSHVRPGQQVSVVVRAYPDRAFSGRVLRLGESLDPTTRTLKVRVMVPNPAGLLKPEMFATAEVRRPSTRSILTIPATAMQEVNGVSVVFVQTAADRFEARPVKTDRASTGRVELSGGDVKAGDRVVTAGSFTLKSQLLKSSLPDEE